MKWQHNESKESMSNPNPHLSEGAQQLVEYFHHRREYVQLDQGLAPNVVVYSTHV